MGTNSAYARAQRDAVVGDLEVVQHMLYAARGMRGLTMIDATNTLSPTILSHTPQPQQVVQAAYAHTANNVSWSFGGYFPVKGELHIIDVGDLSHPRPQSTLPLSGTVHDLAIDGAKAAPRE